MSNITTFNKDLSKFNKSGLNLVATYWTPAQKGESRKLVFIEVKAIRNIIEETGEEKILPTAVFVDPLTNEVVHQSSARLVGVFEREHPTTGEAFEINYLGKIKNSTNAYMSDHWSVYRLQEAL
jgi:hypothetical protein